MRIIGDSHPAQPPLIVVSTTVDEIAAEDGTEEFIVRGEQLRYPPDNHSRHDENSSFL